MEVKNFAKAIGTYLFAEILSLFLALTLSAVGGTLLRIISCICTIGVMLCLCINYAVNRANADRIAKRGNTPLRRFSLSGAVTLPYVLLGLCLVLAKCGLIPPTFYRWYKLLNAPFLQLCNLCSMDVTAASLSWGEVGLLFLVNFASFAAVWIAYSLTRKGVSIEEIQYRK